MELQLADWIVDHLMKTEALTGLGTLGVTKHVVAMLLAAVLLLVVFAPFGARVSADLAPRGVLVNLLESILLFLRDEVVRPFLGKEGDRFLPVVWSFFFFILFTNLIGLLPLPIKVPVVEHGETHWQWFGTVTATGSYWVTGTLAAIAFVWYHGLGIKAQGFVPYVRHIVPSGLPIALLPLIFLLEVVGHIVKPAALTVRLWANMTGGHAVLYATLGMIFTFGVMVAPVSIVAGVAVYCLEIFVAFLQAYVFTFLVVVFLGGALHPH